MFLFFYNFYEIRSLYSAYFLCDLVLFKMANEHMDIIPASENDDSDTEPFAQLMALNPKSDNSSASGNELLEVVNEHKVLGVIQRPGEQDDDN